MKVRQVEPDISKLEIKYVNDCLNRRWLTEGKFAKLFIEKIKEYTGAKYAVLAPNGTLAIYMALYTLGIKHGDNIIIPDLTFNASASPLHFLGARPIFCDINPDTFQIDIQEVEKLLKKYDVKAIIPVHLYGQSADMQPLLELADKKDIIIMEDAAQGLGVRYNGKHVGTMGDAGIISFFADKHIIWGEGGVILTNNEEIYAKLLYLRNQGRLKSGTFEHEQLGMNFRVTDMQCAIGYAQMERIEEIIQRRKKIYSFYEKYLYDENIKMMEITSKSNHIPLRLPVLVENKNKVMQHLTKNGIETRSIELPLHRQPCWQHLNYKNFKNANYVYEHGIRLPLHNKLNKDDVEYVCEKLKEVI